MSLYATIILPEPIPCPRCGEPIPSLQTQAFSKCFFEEFHLGSCVDERAVTRVVDEELYCHACWEAAGRPHVYLAVRGGILVGVQLTHEEALQSIRSFGFDNLLHGYHDLHGRMERTKQTIQDFRSQLMAVVGLLEGKESWTDPMDPEFKALREADSPAEVLRRFLAEQGDPVHPPGPTVVRQPEVTPLPLRFPLETEMAGFALARTGNGWLIRTWNGSKVMEDSGNGDRDSERLRREISELTELLLARHPGPGRGEG